MKPAKNKFTLLKQVVENIPSYLVPKLARKYGIDKNSRTFSPWNVCINIRCFGATVSQLIPGYTTNQYHFREDGLRTSVEACARKLFYLFQNFALLS